MKNHTPVLVDAVLEGLNVRAGGRYIDATFGSGGHSREIVRRGGVVLGIDVDPETHAIHGNFRDIEKIAKEKGFDQADGIVFDLGVSSHQLDTPTRGFSFRHPDAVCDLRMDGSHGIPAWEYIKKLSEEELYEIIATYGEEKLARAIARAIMRARRIKNVMLVGDLIEIIDGVVNERQSRIKSLARVFQALRIAVNDELGALKEGLKGAVSLLTSGGKLAVLSYHSLEDRIVKRETVRLGLTVINKRPIRPNTEEVQRNARSRSAKLRIFKKL